MNIYLEDDIVIVGAGICGLATALALHRKGISSVVLERANSLRATGAGIAIQSNAWRVLDQLGVGSILREKAVRLQALRQILLGTGLTLELPLGKEEVRCLLRSDLIQALFDELPPGTVHFNCQVIAVKTDPATSHSILHFHDGSVATAKVLIGCDGMNSVVAASLELRPTQNCSVSATRGLTIYPNGHGFSYENIRLKNGNVLIGRTPVDDKVVFWFLARPLLPQDSKILEKPELIKQATLEAMKGFPSEIIQMARNSDLDSLTFMKIRYRAPWDLLRGTFRRGAMTVAGDAMHVMGPFLGQGGAAGLEDAIVMARCLAKELNMEPDGKQLAARAGMALDRYIKERRMRVLRLSTQTYLTGLLMTTFSVFTMPLLVFMVRVFFGGPFGHYQYDCGPL